MMKCEHRKRMEREAARAFEQHVILERTSRSWIIGRPNDVCFRQQILVGMWQTVIVHGDGPDLMFRGYSDRSHPLAALNWIARSDIGYIFSKIPFGYEKEVFDPEVALSEIRELLADERKDREDENGELSAEDETMLEEREAAILEVVELHLESGYDYLVRELIDADPIADAWEIWSGVGRIIAPSVYFAHAALKRLVALLDESGAVE